MPVSAISRHLSGIVPAGVGVSLKADRQQERPTLRVTEENRAPLPPHRFAAHHGRCETSHRRQITGHRFGSYRLGSATGVESQCPLSKAIIVKSSQWR
jgi:hypothetical protein